ncbi:MAG: hypothetical protein J6X39_05835 [Bacteroidales bacterium]|nr:hypothetical protein [Bacteroidales bacterium]
MSDEPKTYQPGWGEKKKHHHHHYDERSKHRNRGLGGSVRMRDKQAYWGLVCIIVAGLGFGAYKVFKVFWDEWSAMPHDDPTAEMQVDELRIHKADEQDALLLGDSLAQAYNVDSLKRKVQIETRPVYRPPRREDKWYITNREWKRIWADWKVMRWEKKREKAEKEEQQ